ncbi:hypothetical protein [Gilvibacter sediminis]|uniref:hypothetical protein n=1 Tax=Gilvibacter sediminis TaxID=379071 RepID=UPI0023501E3C|nr:hypothetical protein [Gilvibacter sediminis]MDC7997696.1 hypothetical protein [Gilvibacter sediminis]
MKFFRRERKKEIDFSIIELVRVNSPDSKKVLIIVEEYVDGNYKNTSGLLEWNSQGGGGILHYVKKGSNISANWLDNNSLLIEHDSDIVFVQKEKESFFRGDLVKISYQP